MNMNQTQILKRIPDRSLNTVNFIGNTETTINQPLDVVWPHVLNFRTWQTNFDFQTLEGEEGETGQLYWLTQRKRSQPEQAFLRVVSVEPMRQIVTRAVPVDSSFQIYYMANLISCQDKTTVTFGSIYEGARGEMSDNDVRKGQLNYQDHIRSTFDSYWKKLHSLLGN